MKELREIGIQPDVLLCRADRPLPDDERRKIALFTNVEVEAVISAVDVDCIYKIPGMLHAQKLDDIVCRKLGLEPPPADLSTWDKLVYALEHPQRTVNIALVGKYVDLTESYKSLSEALIHAGIHTGAQDQDPLHRFREHREERHRRARRHGRDPGARRFRQARRRRQDRGDPLRAREQASRIWASASGMQLAVIEYARNVAGSTARTAPNSTPIRRIR